MPEMQQRGGGAQAANRRQSRDKGMLGQFIDDLINLRATAILIIGVVGFGCLVWFYSGKMGGGRGGRGPSVGRLQSEVEDMEKAMSAILDSHSGVSLAAEEAKKMVAAQHENSEKYKAAAIFVFEKSSTNLRTAMRNLAMRPWFKEIVLVHEMGIEDPNEDRTFPKTLNGKPVSYFAVPPSAGAVMLPSMEDKGQRKEFAKFQACAERTSENVNVCYYQSYRRDASGYTRSLWANFLRQPELIHTAVGATTYYNDLELTFRDDTFGLDTGFAYLHGGAYFLKSHAFNFVMRRRGVKGIFALAQDLLFKTAADVLFTLWVNLPPQELANKMVPFPTPIGEPKLIERDAFSRRSRSKEAHVFALKALLQDRLSVMNGDMAMVSKGVQTAVRKPRVQGAPKVGGPVSSCAGDRCILTTNIEIIGRPKSMKAADLGNQLKALLDRADPPAACEVFKSHQYHYAVDGNLDTQWVTTERNVTRDDYFGLDLLKLHKDLQSVTVIAAHPFQRDMTLEVSMDANRWFPITVAPAVEVIDTWRGFEVTRYKYDMAESLAGAWQAILEAPKHKHASTPTPPLYIQYLRFRAQTSYMLPLIVFEMEYAVGDPYDGTASTSLAASTASTGRALAPSSATIKKSATV